MISIAIIKLHKLFNSQSLNKVYLTIILPSINDDYYKVLRVPL